MQDFVKYDPEHFLAKKGLAHPLHSHKNSFMGNENFATSTCGGIELIDDAVYAIRKQCPCVSCNSGCTCSHQAHC